MALLIDVGDDGWMSNQELYDALRPHLPDADLRCTPDIGDPADVVMLAVSRLTPGLAGTLPNLQLVQKLGAGIETIVAAPDLPPQVRVARLRPQTPAREIAEYCLAVVLQHHRHLPFHTRHQARAEWVVRAPDEAPETTVGVLGLGHIGGQTARLFAALDFRVIGWSRTEKRIESIDCRHGDAALRPMLGDCDYVVAVLPSTPATRDLFDADLLAAMKPGAVLVNVGRREPLPPEHAFWCHPKVKITPHVSGWHLGSAGFKDAAENYNRLRDGRPLLNEIDRAAGY